jgi:hypothetical protein
LSRDIFCSLFSIGGTDVAICNLFQLLDSLFDLQHGLASEEIWILQLIPISNPCGFTDLVILAFYRFHACTYPVR